MQEGQMSYKVELAKDKNKTKLHLNGCLSPVFSTHFDRSSFSSINLALCNGSRALSVRSLSCQNLNAECKQPSESNLGIALLTSAEQPTTANHETRFSFYTMSELKAQTEPLNEEGPSYSSRRNSNNSNSSRTYISIIVGVVSATIFLLAVILIGVTLSLTPQIDEKIRKENQEIYRVWSSTFTPQDGVQGAFFNQSLNTTERPG
ncbi:uncharacterized protein LOC106473603 isoform X2 [Limulus polyphemus]|uniref:Uncharacterized protein LOC106473603 isoform X2 n=1 Tax=Limulus polyphemus TaxID=6850 RepID=A0ABM1TS53_LIMPO|nr:uncharacterized protein LOC106473603 isoform X2 [Limulus polyphemus]